MSSLSKVEQKILDITTNSYKSVLPGGFLEGGQWEREMRGLPFFQETVGHLTQRVFGKLIQEEYDEALLNHMLKIEMATEKRETIKTFIEARIKALHKQSTSTTA
jgi:hypothetical protein